MAEQNDTAMILEMLRNLDSHLGRLEVKFDQHMLEETQKQQTQDARIVALEIKVAEDRAKGKAFSGMVGFVAGAPGILHLLYQAFKHGG